MTGSLLDPTTNPDAQEALSRAHGHGTVLVLPLSSGRFAIIDRSTYQIAEIFDQAPTAADLRALSRAQAQKLGLQRMLTSEARFYGEPDDRTYKADALRARRLDRPVPTPKPIGVAFDLGDLD